MPDENDDLVLIVDDTPHNVEVLGSMLKAEGYRLAVAQDGAQALAFVEQKLPDLILLDIMMPGMNGLEVCRRLRSKDATRSIPVIFITALTDTKDKLQGFEAGGVDYVTKPFSGPEVLARVQTHLANARLTRQLRQANDELQELVQLKNRFLGMAAHDLRNPLAAICGFTSLQLEEELFGPLTEQQREFVEMTVSSCQYMLGLVDDLLDIAAIESGKLDLRLKPGSLKALIEERLRLTELVAKGKDIRIRTAIADVGDVVYDSVRIAQVVDNLLSNAVKFSPRQTTVYISLEQEEEFARIEVSDEGPGIPPDEQSRLFGEFQRLSTRPTAGEGSTGLGLAISKRITEAHGGRIRAESEVGIGSTFIILLPLGGPPSEQAVSCNDRAVQAPSDDGAEESERDRRRALAAEQISELRSEYRGTLPEEVAALSDALEAIRHEPGPRQLQEGISLAHRLHGTAGSLGLSHVSELCGEIEQSLTALGSPTDTERRATSWQIIDRALARLQGALAERE